MWRMSNTKAVIFMGWNAGAGARLDRLRAIAAALTGALDWRRPMKIIVDEAGEIIANATDDHILIGGHHRLAVAASLGKRLFWRDTGEPVKLDLFFKHHGSSLRHTACAARRAYRCSGTSRWSSSRLRCWCRER